MFTHQDLSKANRLNHLQQAVHIAHIADITYQQRLKLATGMESQVLPISPEANVWFDEVRGWLEANPQRFVTWPLEPDYPAYLYDLKNPPVILYGQGNASLLKTRALAMVGSRNASQAGLKLTHQFAHAMATKGWVIVSGLAEGVDGAAHRGALDAKGVTIAVLGNGLDNLYPTCHRGLAQQIVENDGLLLSEYPPSSQPRRAFFPQRNRLIAALADGTLVVEAALRSGSLITAKISSELGRPTMAIPGSIHSPHAKGCHAMIKQGAILIETVSEIETELLSQLSPERLAAIRKGAVPSNNNAPGSAGTESNLSPTLDAPSKALLTAMGHEPRHIDYISHHLGFGTEETLSLLTEMELEGYVINEAGARWQRAK